MSDIKRFEDAKKEVFAQKMFFQRLENSRTLDECNQIKNQFSANYIKLIKASETLKELDHIQKNIESKKVKKRLKKAIKKRFHHTSEYTMDNQKILYGNWSIEHHFSINRFREIYQDPRTENILIVTHSTKNGNFLDQNNHKVLPNLFLSPHPNLKSLSFFTCYSDEVIKKHKINNLLEKMQPNFFIGRVKTHTALKGKTPLSSLISYLRSLDSTSSKVRVKKKLSIEDKGLQLSVSIQSPHYLNNFGLFLNGTLIAKLSSYQLNKHWVPSYLLKPGENRIFIRRLSTRKKGRNIQIEFLSLFDPVSDVAFELTQVPLKNSDRLKFVFKTSRVSH